LVTITVWGEDNSLGQLRAKLGRKAKLEPTFRFYTLYCHISRDDVLEEAWKLVRRNGGAAGYDGITIQAIMDSPEGPSGYLKMIQKELRTKSYHASPVKRVYIPKGDGKQRPLGIPTVKDRIVQTALLLIIEPIFEEDFLDCSYGFRPKRSAHQALDTIKEAISRGKTQAYDADLKGYFDSIPHDKLIKAVEKRIADTQVIKLIRKWLQAPIWEPGKPMNRNDKGTPQGGIVSPLLANLYLHWFDKLFNSSTGPGQWAKATLVRYADDFVILARYMTTRVRTWIEDLLEGRFGLVINREKTKIVNLDLSNGELDFLGFTFRKVPVKGAEWRKFCLIMPSRKSAKKARESIKDYLHPKNGYKPIKKVIREVNRFLTGWGNYFSYGHPSKAFNMLNGYVQERLYHFLQRRSQRGYKKSVDRTWYQEFQDLGIQSMTKRRFRVNA